jgi:hypothetical protein
VPVADSPAELLEQAIAETPTAPAPEALKDPEAGASEDAVTP